MGQDQRLTSIPCQAQDSMFTSCILCYMRRCDKARATAHVHNRAPCRTSRRIILADRSERLRFHHTRKRSCTEKYAEDVDVEKALEFCNGGVCDRGGGAYANLYNAKDSLSGVAWAA